MRCLLAGILIFSSLVKGQNNPSDIGIRGQEEISFVLQINCDDLDQCSRDSFFICGSNGKTYDSKCDFIRAFCKERNFEFSHYGACTLSEICRGHRRTSLEKAKRNKGVFIPRCRPDGSYASVQCHNGTGYCWCSAPNGKFLSLVTQNKRPDCPLNLGLPDRDNNNEPPSERPKGCQGKRRRRFNRNLHEKFMKEYQRRHANLGAKDIKMSVVLHWKFKELDSNKDGKLQRSEFKKLQRLIRRHVKPRKCSKKFPIFCDLDSDKKISAKEWKNCFVVGKTKKTGIKKPNIDFRHENEVQVGLGPVSRPEPCRRETNQAVEISSESSSDFYIPKCDENGYYKPIQCYGTVDKSKWYCFCVDVQLGTMIENTSVSNGTPDCPLTSRKKPWPSCPSPDPEARFLESLTAYLLNVAKTINRKIKILPGSTETEAALQKIFSHLDRNKNKVIDKKERRNLRKLIKLERSLWKCGKTIHKVCDINEDNKITSEEFTICILPRKIASNSKAKKEYGSVPKGKHPLIDILRPE